MNSHPRLVYGRPSQPIIHLRYQDHRHILTTMAAGLAKVSSLENTSVFPSLPDAQDVNQPQQFVTSPCNQLSDRVHPCSNIDTTTGFNRPQQSVTRAQRPSSANDHGRSTSASQGGWERVTRRLAGCGKLGLPTFQVLIRAPQGERSTDPYSLPPAGGRSTEETHDEARRPRSS